MPFLLLDFAHIGVFSVIFEECKNVLNVLILMEFDSCIGCINSLYLDRINSFEFILDLGMGEKIDSVDDDMVFFRLWVGILCINGCLVKCSADIDIHFNFEVFDVIGSNSFICLIFASFKLGPGKYCKDGFFDIVEVFSQKCWLNVFLFQPFIVLFIHDFLLFWIILDFNDFSVWRNGLFGYRGLCFLNYRGHFLFIQKWLTKRILESTQRCIHLGWYVYRALFITFNFHHIICLKLHNLNKFYFLHTLCKPYRIISDYGSIPASIVS